MTISDDLLHPQLITTLKQGGVAVLRTDTIYGIVAQADDQAAVERIFQLKQRTPDKPLIVLIATLNALPSMSENARTLYGRLSSQEPTSIVVTSTAEPEWLTRGKDSVAYRVPLSAPLRDLIKRTGPLVAPSANPQGLLPARNIQDAIHYFGKDIDIYVDGGEVPAHTPPSRIIRIKNEAITVVRSKQ